MTWRNIFLQCRCNRARSLRRPVGPCPAVPYCHAFHAFWIYITWQQVTEETIARYFETGLKLSESYLTSCEGKNPRDIENITELHGSFKAGLGLEEQDELQVEYKRDTPKGGD